MLSSGLLLLRDSQPFGDSSTWLSSFPNIIVCGKKEKAQKNPVVWRQIAAAGFRVRTSVTDPFLLSYVNDTEGSRKVPHKGMSSSGLKNKNVQEQMGGDPQGRLCACVSLVSIFWRGEEGGRMGNTFMSNWLSAGQSRSVQTHSQGWVHLCTMPIGFVSSQRQAGVLSIIKVHFFLPTCSAINQCVCMCVYVCVCVAFHMVASLSWPAGRLQGGQEAKSPPACKKSNTMLPVCLHN